MLAIDHHTRGDCHPMKCNQCGADVPAGAAFCSQCGTPLRAAASASPDLNVGAARVQVRAAAAQTPEKDLWSGAYSLKAMTGQFIGAGIVAILAIVGGSFVPPFGWIVAAIASVLIFAYLAAVLLYRRMSIRYRLTTQRLLRDTGILTRTGDHLLVINIDDVTVHQGIFDRMFGLGTIKLNTKDTTTPILLMQGIENPRHVADMIDECRRTERSRRGLYTMDA
jgi:membrane protein YdbS with pleckstrin-like domain